MVVYTQHGQFRYKDTMNDDVAVFSVTLSKEGGKWKCAHVHRATGASA